MKNNFFISIFFLLIGCSSNTPLVKDDMTKTSCPIVLLSSEHSNYIAGNKQPITSENIAYRAEINNFVYSKECFISDKIFQAELSLLFIIKPDQTEEANITLPFYVGVLSAKDEIIDRQYYKVDGKFKSESENENYVETELIKTMKVQIPLLNENKINENKIILGFMLDKKKLDILN